MCTLKSVGSGAWKWKAIITWASFGKQPDGIQSPVPEPCVFQRSFWQLCLVRPVILALDTVPDSSDRALLALERNGRERNQTSRWLACLDRSVFSVGRVECGTVGLWKSELNVTRPAACTKPFCHVSIEEPLTMRTKRLCRFGAGDEAWVAVGCPGCISPDTALSFFCKRISHGLFVHFCTGSRRVVYQLLVTQWATCRK